MKIVTTTAARRRFTVATLRWYARSGRSLPWRQSRDPYRILVSELMLQQTQVDRVIPKFLAFLREFPNVGVLAAAPRQQVVAAWQGLGYNRRALYLQNSARQVITEFGGKFPQTVPELETLPGVGPYTARAVASFAFDAPEAVLDTNVARVLGRYFLGYKKSPLLKTNDLWALAAELIGKPVQRPTTARTRLRPSAQHRLNQALMDLGATICTARKPACQGCPLRNNCRSYPDILTAKVSELRMPKKSKEKLYFGQPRRIWRGKILKFLHTLPNGRATVQQIGQAIQTDYSPSRAPWLAEVVATLAKDGFVSVRGQSVRLAIEPTRAAKSRTN